MVRFALLALAFSLLTTAGVFAREESPRHHLGDAAQDGQGAIWAIEGRSLVVYDGKKWSEVPSPFDKNGGAQPKVLGKLADGAIVCVWQREGDGIAVTRSVGGQLQVLGEGGDPFQPGSALPRLKAERDTASDDKRWWIDAALQRIERDQLKRMETCPR